MTTHFYGQHAAVLGAELRRARPRTLLGELHRRSAPRHGLVALRQFVLLGLCTRGLATTARPLVAFPLVVLQGFTVFDFTVLLHEVVHHAEFGSAEAVPKRHHRSPKLNARWPKLLDATPCPVSIYFRAARRIDPADPAMWTTLVRGRWFWDLAFLDSNYHLRHHDFSGVPFYRRPDLQRALAPLSERRGFRWRSYGGLVRGWLVDNRAPHTNWASAPAGRGGSAAPAGGP